MRKNKHLEILVNDLNFENKEARMQARQGRKVNYPLSHWIMSGAETVVGLTLVTAVSPAPVKAHGS